MKQLYLSDIHVQEATLTQNGDLYAIKLWADQWLVSFNPQKTKSIYISNKTDSVVPPLYFDGLMIDMVTTHKHLDITLSKNLTFNSHIHEVCSKALRRLDIWSCLRFKLPRRALESMYFSFIRPILENGNVFLANCGSVNTDKI